MAEVTKTAGPLHFEDLEPHRFEDLVRQLVYDFKEWRALEATGRSGSDEGFDVRGWETVRIDEAYEQEEGEEQPMESDRLWLIQCKREKSVTPKKLGNYVQAVAKGQKQLLHGMIFASPCNFSKKARDLYRAKCRGYGISECYLWGRAELEDMLFQPKNDNLLFAYFGISVAVRRRSLRTQIRSTLSTKRKAVRHLGGIRAPGREPVLLRDPEEGRYPFKKEIEGFEKHPRWKMYYFIGHYYAGLKFLARSYFAYLADDGKGWDYVEGIDQSRPFDDPWANHDKKAAFAVRRFWNQIPQANRGTLEVIRLVPYDKIIAIDKDGDPYAPRPHIYVPFTAENGPFEPGALVKLVTFSPTRAEMHPKDEHRIEFFPKAFPDPPEQNDTSAS